MMLPSSVEIVRMHPLHHIKITATHTKKITTAFAGAVASGAPHSPGFDAEPSCFQLRDLAAEGRGVPDRTPGGMW